MQDTQSPNGNGHAADPRSNDPGFIPDEELAQLDPETRQAVKERLASLSRENKRMGEMLVRFNQRPAEEQRNGHEPARSTVNPQDITTWPEADQQQAIDDYEAMESRFFANPDDEEAKKYLTSPKVRSQINKARTALAQRAGERAAQEKLAPFEARFLEQSRQ